MAVNGRLARLRLRFGDPTGVGDHCTSIDIERPLMAQSGRWPNADVRWRSGCGTWRHALSKIRDQAPGADGAEPQQKRHERSDFSTVGRFGAPEPKTPPRADMRDQNVDQRRR